jgi:hypothetical protein
MVGTAMPNRGGNEAYMCRDCATRNRPYHSGNNETHGTAKKNMVKTGHEIETAFNDDYARNILFEFGCVPTNDGSLHGRRTCEFVSGTQRGLNISSKMWQTLETLVRQGHIEINDTCGTHCHVSVNDMQDGNGNKTYMDYIRRYYHSLFIPLTEAMQNNPEKTQKLFGRFFNPTYATQVTEGSDPYRDRYLFINAKHDNRIEFRINKFNNAKQAQTLVKMEVEMVNCIIANFCEHFQDPYSAIDARRYYRIVNGVKKPSKDAYRKHKAQVTANKLVKLYEKYSANI